MSRQWYVFKLGKREDTTKDRFAIDPTAPPAAAPNRPARRGVLREQLLTEAFVGAFGEADIGAVPQDTAAGDDGHGFVILREDTKDMGNCFTSEASAERYAKQQAELNPKTLFGVFGCLKVFETTKPSVIEKMYNTSGELLLVEKQA